MNAPFIYVRRPYAQRGAALLRASAMRAAKKKKACPAGRRGVRRAGDGSGGPGVARPPRTPPRDRAPSEPSELSDRAS